MVGSDSPLYQELIKQTKANIDSDRNKGLIYEPKVRWDLKDQQEFDKIPFEHLLMSPEFGGGGLWAPHAEDIRVLWDRRKRFGVNTYCDIRGIGGGKTHKFRNILRLMVLEVITRVNPLEYYGLDPKGQGISFVCMSRNAKLARDVTFETVLPAFDCPFFSKHFPPQVDFKQLQDNPAKRPTMLRFPKNVVIFPGTGSALSAIGYNLMGGGIDEANFLEVVDDSKKAFYGKNYDAAELMYNNIMARMKSRFVKPGGKLPGLIVMFSNPRYENDFLERMAIRSRTDPTLMVTRGCTWESQPKERFSGKVFYFDVINRRKVSKEEYERYRQVG